MASNYSSYKAPPSLAKCSSYENWKKEIEIWQTFTDISREKQGPALFLTLEGKAREAIIELEVNEINTAEGINNVIKRLDKIYLKDKTQAAYERYDKFEQFKRPSEMSITDYINKFESLLNKVTKHGTVISTDVLAYRLLKSANLGEGHEQLVKATLPELKYDNMVTQLKKIFSEKGKINNERETVSIKTEEEVFYTNFNPRYNDRSRGNHYYPRGRFSNRGRSHSYSGYNRGNSTRGKDGRNPVDAHGEVMSCSICQSIYHWQSDCPDASKVQKKNSKVYNINLYQSHLVSDDAIKIFLAESFNSAILDSGATGTVAGKTWMDTYISSLSTESQSQVSYLPSDNMFKFGVGDHVKSSGKVTFPATFGSTEVFITSDVVDCDIPLLLSKNAMKKAKTHIDFVNDSVTMLGRKQNVQITSSGHYAIPLNRNKQILHEVNMNKAKLVLHINSLQLKEDKKKIATKLHSQFSHPPAERLITLVKNAGMENDKELIRHIKEISENCETCLKYKKPGPRPKVGFSLATKFNEVVAMDLKQFEDGWILHLIDHASRFSAAAFIKSKRKEVVIEQIFKIWISIFGPPEKYFSDNGGEFNNEEFQDMCCAMNIAVKTTAAEAPWSNGLCERHNAVLGEMVTKTMEEGTKLSIALMWAIHAKNSLSNVHGFSPYQIVLGYNPKLPSTLTNKLPANEDSSPSEIVSAHLKAITDTRKAFLQAESSEKIKRALRHNVTSSNHTKYFTGDQVWFKRARTKHWKGPATVLGQQGQTVLIKYGGSYSRVHPCRLQMDRKQTIEQSASSTVYYDSSSDEETDIVHANDIWMMRDNENIIEPEFDVDDVINEEEEGNNIVNNDVHEEQDIVNYGNTNDDDMIEDEEVLEDSVNEHGIDDENNSDGDTSEDEFLDATQEQVSFHDEEDQNTEPIHNDNENDKVVDTEIVSSINENNKQDVQDANPFLITGLRKDLEIEYVPKDTEQWIEAMIVSRAGKASGKYRHLWNLQLKDRIIAVDFNNDVTKWRKKDMGEDNLDELHTNDVFVVETNKEEADKVIEEAKNKELQAWLEEGVYNEVDDYNQPRISVKWVITQKLVDNNWITKARLVARGYEEKGEVRSDSPTCVKESLRIVLAISVANSWKINSIDIKSAFLQGKPIDRTVYLKPPREALVENRLWCLNKAVYGLNDASRVWYLRIVEELTKMGVSVSCSDMALFFYKVDGVLCGLILIHVDDFLWSGSIDFKMEVIQNIKEVFKISSEHESAFKYIGINIEQSENNIKIDQLSYIQSLKPIEVEKERLEDKYANTNGLEKRLLRGLVGQLNWITNTTRPDIAYDVCEVATNQSKSKILDILKANKIVRQVKNVHLKICFSKLDIPSTKLAVYHDASYANLHDGGSQGGYIIFLYDAYSKCCPIAWSSKRIKRVVRSSLAAETLEAIEGLNCGFFVTNIVSEILFSNDKQIEMMVLTDNKSLYDAIQTTNVIENKRLRVDISALREMYEKKEFAIHWVESRNQLADALTKKGASTDALINVMKSGQLC